MDLATPTPCKIKRENKTKPKTQTKTKQSQLTSEEDHDNVIYEEGYGGHDGAQDEQEHPVFSEAGEGVVPYRSAERGGAINSW